jgi:peptidoglycan/LPS O-acetylase OafA/YrhL
MRYRSEIDGLRAIAVLPVIFFHAGWGAFSGGFVGVDVFFVISGFLITNLLVTDLKTGQFSLLNFYERRIRRIFPALIIVSFACVPFAYSFFKPHDFRGFLESLVATSAFSSNILFWMETGYFDTAAELKPLLHTWSLAVEEQFYIFFPILLLVVWSSDVRIVVTVFVLVFAASFATAVATVNPFPQAAFFLIHTRAWELILGSILALFMVQRPEAGTKFLREAAGWGGVALIAIAIVAFDRSTKVPGIATLAPCLGAAAIIFGAQEGTLVARLLSFRPLVGIGLISYSAYLWHQPVFAFARYSRFGYVTTAEWVAFHLVVLIFAWLTWWSVERPIRQRKFLAGRRTIFALPVIFVLAATISFWVLTSWREGTMSAADWDILGEQDTRNKYVWALKRHVQGQSYSENERIHLLVIGDSASGDLINMISEMNHSNIFELSSLTIPRSCGNIAFDLERFVKKIPEQRANACEKADRYSDPQTIALIKASDIVLIANRWSDWEVALLAESTDGLVAQYGNKFLIFGSKAISVDLDLFLGMPEADRVSSRVTAQLNDAELNRRLSLGLGTRFVDAYDLFCDDIGCRVFDDNGKLLIYDNFHLTRAGASFLGDRFMSHSNFSKQIDGIRQSQ